MGLPDVATHLLIVAFYFIFKVESGIFFDFQGKKRSFIFKFLRKKLFIILQFFRSDDAGIRVRAGVRALFGAGLPDVATGNGVGGGRAGGGGHGVAAHPPGR